MKFTRLRVLGFKGTEPYLRAIVEELPDESPDGVEVQALMRSVWKELGSTSLRFLGVGRLAAMLLLESVKLTKNAIALPFVSSAKTPLTGQVTAGRQFATAAVASASTRGVSTPAMSTGSTSSAT